MNLIDLMNRIGQDKRFSPLGRSLLLGTQKTRLSVMCRIAGRRLVSAFAGAGQVYFIVENCEDIMKGNGFIAN